jgi:hypothetical protein
MKQWDVKGWLYFMSCYIALISPLAFTFPKVLEMKKERQDVYKLQIKNRPGRSNSFRNTVQYVLQTTDFIEQHQKK